MLQSLDKLGVCLSNPFQDVPIGLVSSSVWLDPHQQACGLTHKSEKPCW